LVSLPSVNDERRRGFTRISIDNFRNILRECQVDESIVVRLNPNLRSRLFDGSKRYEYRRVIFRCEKMRTVVVYASAPIKEIIGEFDIGDILHDDPTALWAQTCNEAGITKEEIPRVL